jgi:hypothetical protein
MNVLNKFKDFMGLNREEDYDESVSSESLYSIQGSKTGAVDKLTSMHYSHIEDMIDKIVLDLHTSDLRIQEYQEEIDSLKADTKEMISNLKLIIK